MKRFFFDAVPSSPTPLAEKKYPCSAPNDETWVFKKLFKKKLTQKRKSADNED